MELKLDEQTLVTNFRALPQAGQKELADFAAFLVRKYRDAEDLQVAEPENSCKLKKEREVRPEAASEPLFTE